MSFAFLLASHHHSFSWKKKLSPANEHTETLKDLRMQKLLNWIKANKLLAAAIAIGAWWLFLRPASSREGMIDLLSGGKDAKRERFSSCYQRKQIYLNSCSEDEPTGMGDVNLEKRWGKLYINIQANLPYARGGVFHTMWGAYHAFLVDSRNQRSINLGSLVRHGDRMYKLSTELLGDYTDYDRIDVYRQTEDYAPKRVLTGTITGQQCTSL